MGLISRVLEFTRITQKINNVDVSTTDVKGDPGGGANTTATHFGAPGDDAFPLQSDYVATIPTPGSGRRAAVGYLDPVNSPAATEGERRIYARDPTDGSVVAEVWLKSDSSILLSNALGSIELGADGIVTINGVTIDVSGNIATAGTITSGTVSVAAHAHAPGTYNIGGTPVTGSSATPTP